MLEGMLKTDLKIIDAHEGSVMHFLKKTEAEFHGFGEVYFSTVSRNVVKAWKMHQMMTLNLVVPVGKVLWCFSDAREKSKTHKMTFKIVLSQNPYFRLTVPPGIWFGFKGLSEGINLVCNMADIPHDPQEVLRKDFDEIVTNWSTA